MRAPQDDKLRVWDPLVRLLHWSLVASVAPAWLLAERWRAGHEGAGYAVLGLVLLALAGTGLSGWMMALDTFFGDEWLEALHEALANGLLVLVALHVAGALFTGWQHAENLVLAMFSGRKRKPQPGDMA